MTEYELIDLAMTWIERQESASLTYFTVISAYMVTAYTVGQNLKSRQAFVVSVLFVAFAVGPTLAMLSQLGSLLEVAHLRMSLYPDSALQANVTAIKGAYLWVFIQSAGILVALNFMWDIRHPKP